jgi:uncharacterized membrane protein YwaF
MAYIKTKYKQDIILVINMLSMLSSFEKVKNSKKIGPLIGDWPYYILALQLITLLQIYIIHLIVKPK